MDKVSQEFKTVQECLKDLELRCEKRSPIDFQAYCREQQKLAHRQVCCKTCGRWKWPEERCNLFIPTATRGPRSQVSASGNET